jgi:ElaB/YqjD/DUF883 family membrane-anchored ribosome-binding protein
MKKHKHVESHEISRLAEDAHALLAATADVAGEKVAEARERLAARLENAKEIAGRVRDKTVEYAKAADAIVRVHPYKAIAVGVGVGTLIGFLVARGRSGNGD